MKEDNNRISRKNRVAKNLYNSNDNKRFFAFNLFSDENFRVESQVLQHLSVVFNFFVTGANCYIFSINYIIK